MAERPPDRFPFPCRWFTSHIWREGECYGRDGTTMLLRAYGRTYEAEWRDVQPTGEPND